MSSPDPLNEARAHLDAGRLTAAVEATLAVVKARPTDSQARGFLIELACLSGDLERADRQLEALATQDPGAAVGVALWRQLVRAEQWRRQFFREGRVPELLGPPDECVRLALEASVRLRAGENGDAERLLAELEEKRPRLRGTADGQPFDDFRDLDDRVAGVLEVLTSNGKYYWVPLERVASLELHAPARPRDLLWRRATLEVSDGPEGEVFLPTTYEAPAEELDDAARLGRRTDWLGGEGQPVRGVGLRTFLVGDEDRTVLEIGRVELGG